MSICYAWRMYMYLRTEWHILCGRTGHVVWKRPSNIYSDNGPRRSRMNAKNVSLRWRQLGKSQEEEHWESPIAVAPLAQEHEAFEGMVVWWKNHALVSHSTSTWTTTTATEYLVALLNQIRSPCHEHRKPYCSQCRQYGSLSRQA